MLNFGWVDFTKNDQDIVLNVLRHSAEPEDIDELGIGSIRDQFSNLLFPGTSTIQTRAKYLFIVPYLCVELEKKEGLNATEFIEQLEQQEYDLIEVLNVDGAEGVIGTRSKQDMKLKPSSLYWHSLKTFDLIKEEYRTPPRDFSRAEYAAFVCRKNGGLVEFWNVPPNHHWREGLTISLTKKEAVYLKERILTGQTRHSLLAHILRENRKDFLKYNTFSDIDALESSMTDEVRSDYRLARDFSLFIFGAQIRYNVIFSKRKNDVAMQAWEGYILRRPAVDLNQVARRLQLSYSLMHFLQRFQSFIGNEPLLDELIMEREKSLKGSARAKLTNEELYNYQGQHINMTALSYRLRYAQRIAKDIFEGLGDHA